MFLLFEMRQREGSKATKEREKLEGEALEGDGAYAPWFCSRKCVIEHGKRLSLSLQSNVWITILRDE